MLPVLMQLLVVFQIEIGDDELCLTEAAMLEQGINLLLSSRLSPASSDISATSRALS